MDGPDDRSGSASFLDGDSTGSADDRDQGRIHIQGHRSGEDYVTTRTHGNTERGQQELSRHDNESLDSQQYSVSFDSLLLISSLACLFFPNPNFDLLTKKSFTMTMKSRELTMEQQPILW